MPIAPPLYVQAPATTPARYGLIDAANIIAEQNPRFLNGIEYIPASCGSAKLHMRDCLPDPDADLAFDGTIPGMITAHPITVYNDFKCKLLTDEERLKYAREALAGGEQTAIERALWSDVSLIEDSPSPRLMGAQTDVLTADAVSLVTGISMLERELRENYGGVGVIHAPVEVAGPAAKEQQIRWEQSKPVTTLGTRYSFGAYPNSDKTGAIAAEGTAWLVGTGAVNLRRSETKMVGNFAESVDPITNEIHALAERTYVVAWECVTAAVLVTLP